MNTYEELKLEYNRQSFRKVLREQLGDECCNCGEKGVTYHHIVPLKRGGTK